MNDRHLQALRQNCIKNRQFNNRNGQNVDFEVTLRLTVSEQSLMFYPQKQVKALTNQKSEIIFKNWCMSCPQHEREEGPSVSLSMQSSKARIRDGMGCTNAHGMGNLHICKGYINAEQYTQYAAIQVKSLLGKALQEHIQLHSSRHNHLCLYTINSCCGT